MLYASRSYLLTYYLLAGSFVLCTPTPPSADSAPPDTRPTRPTAFSQVHLTCSLGFCFLRAR